MAPKHKIYRFAGFAFTREPGEALLTAGQLFDTRLTAILIDNATGGSLDYVDLGSGLVTTAGVNLLAQDWNASSGQQVLKIANQHDSGTGTTAAAIGDTALQTPTGNARVAGTQSNPISGQYRTIATLSYAATFAITEWGLFTATSGTTLWDRRVFSALNVDSSTSIEFTYTLTINAGG